ncbi:hypothetical protein BSZ36_02550 [Rubricoccus marinus]|uniref:Uncharacterized protein n=2 Tax=Rubricoccus marinus TaxID=716817 RepID=A0A259TWN7_9BACT|nr:hypothetical protein BSZ36_02550 [Rubricoccus marinus]
MMEMEMMADTVEVVTFDPDRSRMLSMQADSLFKASDYEMALERYSEGYELDSTYAKNPFGQARSYVRLNNLKAAMVSYRKAIELAEGVEGMGNIFDAAREERRVVEARIEEEQGAQAVNDKITRATTLLQAEPLSESAANTAFELLEDVRMNADYDSSQVAFYYAKALNALGRSQEATHYAQLAVDQSEGQPDRSAYFIQLGLAHMGAENEDAAREAFTAAKEGSWASWAEYYLNEMENANAEAGG